ncbi:hypothetical protein PG988_000100 [Apiospora saccharicola]
MMATPITQHWCLTMKSKKLLEYCWHVERLQMTLVVPLTVHLWRKRPEYLLDLDFGSLICLPRWQSPHASQHCMLDYLQTLYAENFPSHGDVLDILMSAEGLVKAAVSGGPVLLNRLRAKGANFNCHTPDGKFPIGAVVALSPEDEKVDRCKALVALAASVDYKPGEGIDQESRPSALHIASLLGHYDVLEFLLGNGANQHTPVYLENDGTWLVDLDEYPSGIDLEHTRSPLSWAISRCFDDCILLLLESGAPIEGHELLLYMESLDSMNIEEPFEDDGPSVAIVADLIARGVDPDLRTDSGKTALDIAISISQSEIVNVLLSAGATMSTVTTPNAKEARDAFIWASQLRWAIRSYEGCKEEDYDMFLESLHEQYRCESVEWQNERLDNLATEVGSALEYRDSHDGDSYIKPLYFFLKCYPEAYSSYALQTLLKRLDKNNITLRLPAIRELLSRRKLEYINAPTESKALAELAMRAIRPGLADLCSLLEVLRAQPFLLNVKGYKPWHNPLIRAFRIWYHFGLTEFPKPEITDLRRLLHKLVDIGIRVDTAAGLRAIEYGCSTKELELLMAHGFRPQRRYRWSDTALQYAVSRGNLDMVELLLDRGVNVNGRPCWGSDPRGLGVLLGTSRTALQLAVENENWECMELLIKKGADVNAPAGRFRGATALQFAAIKGHIGLVRWLIEEKEADINAAGAFSDGLTALEGAAAFGRLDVVGLLLEYGHFNDGEGRRQYVRAVSYARRSRRQALSSYMMRQAGWSRDDEQWLAREILVEEVAHRSGLSRMLESGDQCRNKGCIGETESVSEDIEEPECCHIKTDMDALRFEDDGDEEEEDEEGEEEGDEEKEALDSHGHNPVRNEDVYPMSGAANGGGERHPQPNDEGDALRVSVEDQMDKAAPMDVEMLDWSARNQTIQGMDSEFLPNFNFEIPRLPATGLVMGELVGVEEPNDEYSGNQEDEMGQRGETPWDLAGLPKY